MLEKLASNLPLFKGRHVNTTAPEIVLMDQNQKLLQKRPAKKIVTEKKYSTK